MSHLGERVTPLVDGQLPADVAERAYAHVASCPVCREAVEIERLVKSRLAALAGPAPDAALTARLLGMADPGGPVPPRARPVPGSAVRPAPSAAWSRPPGRSDPSRPATASRRGRRGTRVRVLAAAAGALCLVGAAALAVGAVGLGEQPAVVPPVDQFVIEHDATTLNLPYGDPAGTGR